MPSSNENLILIWTCPQCSRNTGQVYSQSNAIIKYAQQSSPKDVFIWTVVVYWTVDCKGLKNIFYIHCFKLNDLNSTYIFKTFIIYIPIYQSSFILDLYIRNFSIVKYQPKKKKPFYWMKKKRERERVRRGLIH